MNEPQSVGEILAVPMSRVDGCPTPSCDNSEPPQAAVPTAFGWRIAYHCGDCGTHWEADTSHTWGSLRGKLTGVKRPDTELVPPAGPTDQSLGRGDRQ